jgi:alkylation response protein AidB-like acyl-CoA dehydrogenase
LKKSLPAQYHAAMRLEHLLGDPGNPDNLLSFRRAMAWDEQEQFPESAMARLHQLKLHHGYVPASLGGRFELCESFIALGRTLARRNMSVVISYSTMLWTMLAWMGGNPDQQRTIARAVLEKGEFPCLAYSEELHGADLLANETTARVDEAGQHRVSGEKWPVNRATRSQWVVLLARTAPASHLRNHSLFIFRKAQLDAREYHHLPGPKTHGLRGCDISGIGFHDCRLPQDARIGREGNGIELALKGFQITRTFCTALSLGVGDSALRLVADFASQRKLYGVRVADLPHTRDTLANAYLSLLIGECASVVAARGLHLFPEQFSHWSSIAKVQVVRLTDYATQQLAAVLGARSYLRETHAEGMFQKLLRDGAIVAVFDGSNIVCLDWLATGLSKLCRVRNDGPAAETIAALFDLRLPLPPLAFDRFNVIGSGKDAVMQSLPLLAMKLGKLSPEGDCDAAMLELLNEQARRLQEAVAEVQTLVRHGRIRRNGRNSAALIGSAERYCALHSAICCLGIWLFNRDHFGGFMARGEWLAAALARQGEAIFQCGTMNAEIADGLCERVFEQTEKSQMYSLLPWPLAATGQREQDSGYVWDK